MLLVRLFDRNPNPIWNYNVLLVPFLLLILTVSDTLLLLILTLSDTLSLRLPYLKIALVLIIQTKPRAHITVSSAFYY